MKKLISNFTFLLAVICLAFSSPVFSQIDESFSNVKKVKFDIAVGDIQLQKSNSGKTELLGNYDEGKLNVEVLFKNGELSVIEKTKKKKTRGSIDSKYTLSIPDDIFVNINTGTGDVSLNDLSTKTNINTGTGMVSFQNYNGASKLNSGTGNVRVIDSKGDIDMNSGTGNVMIENSSGDLVANSGTGNVKVDKVKGKLAANSGTGNVKGSNVHLEGTASFNSGTGAAQYVLTGEVSNDLSVNSGTGDAILDMNGQRFEGTLIMKCDKDHGSISAPFSFDKTETKDDTLIKYKYFGDSGVEIQVSTGTGKAKVMK
ncbi:MAG: hypothetical protein AAFZ15_01015 [Bacteroidota bacterium]